MICVEQGMIVNVSIRRYKREVEFIDKRMAKAPSVATLIASECVNS